MTLVEFILCFASFGLYVEERARVFLYVSVFSFFVTALGFYAKLTLSFCKLLMHAVFTIPVFGGFYIYTVIYALMTQGQIGKEEGLGDSTILILSSLPYLGLFLLGIYSCVLCIRVDEELEARQNVKKSNDGDRAEGRHLLSKVEEAESTTLHTQEHTIEILAINEAESGNECVICLDNPKTMFFYPCGHLCLCSPCAQRFKQEAQHQLCPLCHNRITDMVELNKK